MHQLLQEVVRTTAIHMDLKAGAVRLIDTETGELAIHAVCGLSDEFLSLSPRFESTEVDSLRVIANQVSLAIKLARLYEVEAEKERLEHQPAAGYLGCNKHGGFSGGLGV